jgi:putative phosphoribosyl transferase
MGLSLDAAMVAAVLWNFPPPLFVQDYGSARIDRFHWETNEAASAGSAALPLLLSAGMTVSGEHTLPAGEFGIFHDRHDAGRQLAQRLLHYTHAQNTLVLALPRGGVVLGYDISLALRVPLDVLITRKLGTPMNPELAMGALAETGYVHLNQDVILEYQVTKAQLDEETRRQQQEIERRRDRYRMDRALPPLKGQTVILVDDGIATGATFFASLGALQKAETERIVAAVPVAPPRVVAQLRNLVDEVVVLHTSEWFFGIGQFYEHFAQVEDAEVVVCLEGTRKALASGQDT